MCFHLSTWQNVGGKYSNIQFYCNISQIVCACCEWLHCKLASHIPTVRPAKFEISINYFLSLELFLSFLLNLRRNYFEQLRRFLFSDFDMAISNLPLDLN